MKVSALRMSGSGSDPLDQKNNRIRIHPQYESDPVPTYNSQLLIFFLILIDVFEAFV